MNYGDISNQVESEFQCDHETAALTRFVKSNDTVEFRMQCRHCGANLKAMKRRDLTQRQMDEALPYDAGIRGEWYRRRQEFWDECASEARAQENAEQTIEDCMWWDRYHRHINSAEWAWRRGSVLRRAKYICEGCQKAKASHAHHLSYDMLGKELLFDLVALCERCHEAAHGRRFRGKVTPPSMPEGYHPPSR